MLSRFFCLFLPVAFTALCCLSFSLVTPACGESRSLPDTIHPERLDRAVPYGGVAVTQNPPILRWPVTSGRQTRYAVRLSPDKNFPPVGTIHADGLRWALFNAHQELEPGNWYWQYAMKRRETDEPRWSDVFQFRVTPAARRWATPSADRFLGGCPKTHPRILVPSALTPDRAILSAREIESIRARVQRLIGTQLPDADAGKPSEKGKNAFEQKNFAKWSSKGFAARLLDHTRQVVHAYAMTGDERIGREAVRRGLHVAALDPDGVTSRSVSDFADGSCMEAMALVYDTCYDLLTSDQRAQLKDAMMRRAERFFDRCINDLESRIFSAHIWQHILWQATQVAVALKGDVPEADMWLTYVYELWNARFPPLSRTDGGWANGVNYFGTNFHTIEQLPSLFQRWTRADFYDHPWYRNTPYYLLYCWPPESSSDGFGDGSEREGPPPASRGEFVLGFARRFQDPYALWYAAKVLGTDSLEANRSSTLAPKEPTDLPLARLFEDIGVVSAHTDLTTATNDLMVGFRSSPFGSYNHMHCDQNSVHILYGGQRLFSGSGYYIAYGDEHFKEWYIHTRGQNSVLIDGQGQRRGTSGYGWIARYLHGEQITYCVGDASAAYPPEAGLTCYRRHLVFLRPNTLIIYDELRADHPARWSWLLHSPHPIQASGNQLSAASPIAAAQVDLSASNALRVTVSTEFDPPAINWRNRRQDGKVVQYPDQYHVRAVPVTECSSLRVLSVIQVVPKDDGRLPEKLDVRGSVVRVGPWEIVAQRDPDKPATLTIRNREGTTGLASGPGTLTVGNQSYDVGASESLLVEKSGELVRQDRERWPSHVVPVPRTLAP